MTEPRAKMIPPAGHSLRTLLARHAIRTGRIPTVVFAVFLLGAAIAVLLWISRISQDDLVRQARKNLAFMTTQIAMIMDTEEMCDSTGGASSPHFVDGNHEGQCV